MCSLRASPGCRDDRRRAAGDLHHQALRALANRLVGYLHGCLRTRSRYESTAWDHRSTTQTSLLDLLASCAGPRTLINGGQGVRSAKGTAPGSSDDEPSTAAWNRAYVARFGEEPARAYVREGYDA